MKRLFSIAVLAAACTTLAQGASEAILGYTNNISGFVDATAGWTFQTTRTITVTELGCFAKVFEDNPLVTALQVGLWDNTGAILASTSVTPASTLFDQTRYESITRLRLVSGQIYHLGVYNPGGILGVGVAGAAAGGTVGTAPEVQLRAMALGSGGFASPAELAGTSGSLYAGPNFQFESRPRLSIELVTGNQVRLSWSTAFPGYTLQSEVGLTGTWTDAGLSVSTVGDEFVAFDSIGSGPKYYRLAE